MCISWYFHIRAIIYLSEGFAYRVYRVSISRFCWIFRCILLNLFGLRDIIIVFTSASDSGIVSISTNIVELNNDEALHVSLCLIFEFVTIGI
jgi:hypothetical protein